MYFIFTKLINLDPSIFCMNLSCIQRCCSDYRWLNFVMFECARQGVGCVYWQVSISAWCSWYQSRTETSWPHTAPSDRDRWLWLWGMSYKVSYVNLIVMMADLAPLALSRNIMLMLHIIILHCERPTEQWLELIALIIQGKICKTLLEIKEGYGMMTGLGLCEFRSPSLLGSTYYHDYLAFVLWQ